MAFYIMSENGVGDVYEMDATVSHSYALTGKPTDYAVEDGTNSSDHYNKDLIALNYSGVVSDVKYQSGAELSQDVADFEEGIVALRDSGEFFACNFSDDQRLVKNCLFTSLRISRSPQNGRYAIAVDFTVKQVRVANVSVTTASPQPFETFVDAAEEKKKGGGSTEQPDKKKNLLIHTAVNSIAGSNVF